MILMEALNLDIGEGPFQSGCGVQRGQGPLCQLDGAIGDGDHGASMARGFEETEKSLSSSGKPADVATLFRAAEMPF